MKPRYAARARRLQWAIGWVALFFAAALQAQPAPARSHAAAGPRTVLVMGDSLSAAYGLPAAQGWVALTADRIAATRPGWRVVNASISGETSAGGAARIVDAVVRTRPSVVVVALGANDALRGLPLRQTRRNLARMIGASRGVGARVLLVGMRIPPNYGAAYTREFERGYRDLATRFDTALVPFLLQPVASRRDNFQDDNLHPTAAAQPAIRDHVWKVLEPMLDR
jgi:acyl-CoA thioesterase-1